MGFTIIPLCKQCGYQTKAIAVGGGKLNHLTQCGAPAFNIESNEIEQVNLYDCTSSEIVKQRFLYFFYRNVTVVKTDDRYIPYYEPKMFVDDKKIGSHNWSGKYYKKSKNFCPKCKSFNLDFLNGGVYFD
ncbi:hypothetical protein [Flavobacterium ovatum]|uniref:hypothetical protein n=1 Tax=Flavobacterium ovatum TaxID=1928857 RepID=UPI00345035D8